MLDVVDLRGHLVRNLVAGQLPAGSQTFVWDGNDERGRTAPSGVYFARLRFGEEVRSLKMLLAK